MFWCIICDGYEAIDKSIVVLGHGNRAASLALQLLVFTQKVTLVAWDGQLDLNEDKIRALKEQNIDIYDCDCTDFSCSVEGRVSSLTMEGEGGKQLDFDMLFVAQRIVPNNGLANKLNLMCDEHGFIVVDAEASTNIKGVFAAGDITRLFNHQVSSAVHEGGMAAAAANHYLYAAWQHD